MIEHQMHPDSSVKRYAQHTYAPGLLSQEVCTAYHNRLGNCITSAPILN